MTEVSRQPVPTKLDPLWKRLVVFGVLIVLAILSIRVIDRRAMQHMEEMRRQPAPAASATAPSAP